MELNASEFDEAAVDLVLESGHHDVYLAHGLKPILPISRVEE